VTLADLRLRWHFVRHTRPRQIAARFALGARRAVRDRGLAPRAVASGATIADALPQPLFPPRPELVAWDGGLPQLQLVGVSHPWSAPYVWHPTGWPRGRLETLVLHSMEYLEGLDDASFAATVRSWIETDSGREAGAWRDAWNSWTLATRSVVWMQELARRGSRLGLDLRLAMARSLDAQLRFLERNLEHDLGGNHLIRDLLALAWAARFFRGPDAARWGRTAERLLERELDEQVLADGMHFERSPAYHAVVLADLLACASVLSDGPVRARLFEALGRMSQVLSDLTHPDGQVSLFNDGGLHMARPSQTILDGYRRVSGLEVTPRAAIDLPDAGYFGRRDGTDYLLVDCGAVAPDHLPAHGHGDVLSFEWDLSGRRLVVDAGVFEYHGPWRPYSRSTVSHNTVTVDDADQCEFWSAFRIGRRPRLVRAERRFEGEGLTLDGSHDGYARLAGRPIHHRTVRASAGRLEIDDRVVGGAGQPVRARLLCHPACAVHATEGGVSFERDGVRARLRTASPASITQAWWMPDFGRILATNQIVLEYGAAPCSAGFTLERA
jgi:uncharacterized heparinase superfamily protein